MKRVLLFLMAAVMALSISVTALAADPGFTDIPADADCAQAVSWCQENNILNGVGGDRFDPDGTLTRAMLAAALYRAAGEPAVSGAPAFTDTQPGIWYSNAVIWANENGLVRGYGNGLFGANDPVSVEQLEVILARYTGDGPEWTGDPAKAHAATRAQIAVALYNALAKEDSNTTNKSGKVLVAYFSMPDNVDDSTVTIDGRTLGNNQYFAQIIQETTRADVFRIEPQTPYPTDHSTLVDQAQPEQREDARPAIKGTIEDFEDYDTVFIGYPIWWSDMPQIMYTFFDTYDFSGKVIIPFGTHGGSGWARTPSAIAELEPNATILDGLSISRDHIQDARNEIVEWVKGLDG